MDSFGGCTAETAAATTYHALGDPIAADRFVAGDESWTDRGRLSMLQVDAEDGARYCDPQHIRVIGDTFTTPVYRDVAGGCDLVDPSDNTRFDLPGEVVPAESFADGVERCLPSSDEGGRTLDAGTRYTDADRSVGVLVARY